MSFPDYQYSPRDAAVYNAFGPILWGTFITLGIFLAANGYAGKRIKLTKPFGSFNVCYSWSCDHMVKGILL